jgi:predicted N-acetyltransferase YhbS
VYPPERHAVLHIRSLTAADVPSVRGLTDQAGWNQTEADWQRFVKLQPSGCFLAEWDGKPVGTTTTSRFGSVAWLAMVLVDETMRGRGIGTALVRHALDFLDRQGVATVRLDATPLGQPIYERLGFVPQFTMVRYAGTLPGSPPVEGVSAASPEQLEALAKLDRAVTRTDRRVLLHQLFCESPEAVRIVAESARLRGFLMSRPGARAVQVGPCEADAEAGPLLFRDAWHRLAGRPVFIDIPSANEPARKLAEAQGLTIQRHLTRMCRGVALCERVEPLWAGSGPEKG